MRTELINGVEVTIIEDAQDMLENIKDLPVMFNARHNDRTITTSDGFELCVVEM